MTNPPAARQERRLTVDLLRSKYDGETMAVSVGDYRHGPDVGPWDVVWSRPIDSRLFEEFNKRAWLAGHAAGVEAGREQERARVCRWKMSGGASPAFATQCGCVAAKRYRDEPRCYNCGGRIEVTELEVDDD